MPTASQKIDNSEQIAIDKKLRLSFCGGVGSVTGANFLLEGPSIKLLVDCGMEQGSPEADASNHAVFAYDPSKIDFLFITHAHIDHIGRIPKLVRDGFKGTIYSTPETKSLTIIMLDDALRLGIQEAEAKKVPPMYEQQDVDMTFKLWKTIPYHQDFPLENGFNVVLKDSGHVLGSTMYEFTYTAPDGVMDKAGKPYKRKIVFTGDLGNSPTPLLKDTEDITDADYLLMESVYGDRNHEDRETRLQKLEQAIIDTHNRKGILLIPIFSLEKTQEILFEIHKLFDEKKLPVTPIYLDSPLAIKLTDVYKRLNTDFNAVTETELAKHHDIFNFPGLRVVDSARESKSIFTQPSPKIIMAGSGMSNGGRIQHHELNYLGDPLTTILLIGYQAVGTLGRQIQEGAKKVSIYGQSVVIKATIQHIDGYSSHKDSEHLVEFAAKDEQAARTVFVVMGETKASLFLVQQIRDYTGMNAVHPNEGDTVILE